MNPPPLTMQAGDWRAGLAPALGGALLYLRHRGEPVMREWPDEGNVRRTACFPLVPYANRIAQAGFEWQGAHHALARNFGDHPHALHGIGWQRAWSVQNAAPDRVCLSLHHDPQRDGAAGWPFAFLARQEFRLGATGLAIGLELTNLAPIAAPAGIGLHPFFRRTPDVSLGFAATGIWRNGPDDLPLDWCAMAAPWDHAMGRRLDDSVFDHDFSGWEGHAMITEPSLRRRIVMVADPVFTHLRIFTPAGRDFFAVEPVSHRADAVHHPEQADSGWRVLAPGESLRGWMRLEITLY